MVRSNDKPRAVRIEIRAAELNQIARPATKLNMAGYSAHFRDADPPRNAGLEWWAGWLDREMSVNAGLDWWAGWLDREMSIDAEYEEGRQTDVTLSEASEAKLVDLVAQLPAVPHSDPHWQDRVLDAIDQAEPATPDEAQLVDMPDRDSDEETTHVGAVDDRFDNGGTL